MGPAATIRLYEEITARTPVQTDQDHIPLVIESNPAIPDRTEALLGGGPDPLPAMLESLRRLAAAGADSSPSPATPPTPGTRNCAGRDRPRSSPDPHRCPGLPRRLTDGAAVGVLATTGTIDAELYQTALGRHGPASRVAIAT